MTKFSGRIDLDGNNITLSSNEAASIMYDINKELVSAGIPVIELKIIGHSLEEAYFKVMEGC